VTMCSYMGLGGAPGVAEGPAVVLRDQADATAIPMGAVVVAHIIHPHLTPLFVRIAGVVVEEGALLQHATTLAREFGVPAVVGLKGATDLIRTGDRVRVDGGTGEVAVVDGGAYR
jgi:phosphohistidine swiveling domain-containing protein